MASSLAIFEFDIKFNKGKDNSLPDFVSRVFVGKHKRWPLAHLNQASIKLSDPLALLLKSQTIFHPIKKKANQLKKERAHIYSILPIRGLL